MRWKAEPWDRNTVYQTSRNLNSKKLFSKQICTVSEANILIKKKGRIIFLHNFHRRKINYKNKNFRQNWVKEANEQEIGPKNPEWKMVKGSQKNFLKILIFFGLTDYVEYLCFVREEKIVI